MERCSHGGLNALAQSSTNTTKFTRRPASASVNCGRSTQSTIGKSKEEESPRDAGSEARTQHVLHVEPTLRCAAAEDSFQRVRREASMRHSGVASSI